jgi:hypothetical protein
MTTIEATLEPPVTPHGAERPSPLALLFAPDRGMERQARVGKALFYLLFAWLCAMLLATALAVRVDARSSTLKKMEMSGQLQGMSDRQIADETRNAERVFMVGTIAKGVVGTPVDLGLACLAIIGLTWFFRGRLKGSAVAPVAAATLAPRAIADLLDAASALMHAAMPPEGVPLSPRTLTALAPLVGHPLMGPFAKLGNALDFFSLWAAVMMGYGVAAAGQVPKRTAVLGTIVAWVCYRLLTQVAMGG